MWAVRFETFVLCVFTPNVQQQGCGCTFSPAAFKWTWQLIAAIKRGSVSAEGRLFFFLGRWSCGSAVLRTRGEIQSAALQRMLFACKTHTHILRFVDFLGF